MFSSIELAKQLAKSIQQVQMEVRWKPGSATRHLHKRKLRRHLPLEATITDYEQVIQTVLTLPQAVVYLYWFQETPYPTIVGTTQEQRWLVMFSLDGILESAFVVENPETYLTSPEFEWVGLLEEVLDES